MKCAKTGLTFRVIDRPYDGTYVGDLFFIRGADIFLIRGIPKGTDDREPDIEFTPYKDIYIPVKISEKLTEFWKEWNTDIPVVGPTIINDTRFF